MADTRRAIRRLIASKKTPETEPKKRLAFFCYNVTYLRGNARGPIVSGLSSTAFLPATHNFVSGF